MQGIMYVAENQGKSGLKLMMHPLPQPVFWRWRQQISSFTNRRYHMNIMTPNSERRYDAGERMIQQFIVEKKEKLSLDNYSG